MENKRQQQMGRVIQQSLSEVFQKNGFGMYKNALVTISAVRMTPDLGIARVYLSIFNAKDREEVLSVLNKNLSSIRYELGKIVRHQVRKVPELELFLDETLDEVFKIDKIFEGLNAQKKKD